MHHFSLIKNILPYFYFFLNTHVYYYNPQFIAKITNILQLTVTIFSSGENYTSFI